MNIDKILATKKNDWKRQLFMFVCTIFGLSFVFLLVQNTSLRKQIHSNNTSNTLLNQLSDELAKKEEEIKLCIEDKPKYGEATKERYSYQELGVYSPDFEGKAIEITTYEYKRNKIIRKSIRPDESLGQRWGVDVWELDSYSYNLPSLEGYTAFGRQNNFPIFDGYENYGTPRWISDRITDWEKQESYTNKNDIKMYLSYDYAPKTIGSVQYEFYNPNSPSGNQAFIVLWNGVKDYPLAGGVSDPFVVEAKEELKKLADNVNLRMIR